MKGKWRRAAVKDSPRRRLVELSHPNKLGVMFPNQKISPLDDNILWALSEKCPHADLAAPIFPGEGVFVSFSGRPEVTER